MWPVGMTISDVLRVFFLSLLSDGSLAHISIVTLRYRYTDICMDSLPCCVMSVSELGHPRSWVLNWVSHAPESVHERIVWSCDGISANNISEFIHHVEEGKVQEHQRQSGSHRHSGTAAVNGKRCSWQLSPQHIVRWHWQCWPHLFWPTVLVDSVTAADKHKFSAKKRCKNVWWPTSLACESLEQHCRPTNLTFNFTCF